jgi:hypothetical protein
VFNVAGEELDPSKPIIGGTQPGKKIDQDTFRRLAETNTQRIKQRISDKKVETEEEIAKRLGEENKQAAQRIRNRKMVKDAVDNASPGFVKGDRKYNAQLVADDLAQKMYGLDFYDLDQRKQIDLYDQALDGLDDSDKFAQGGRAGYKFGIGPLIELLSKTSPKQAYTKYLKSVKDRAQKGDMKSLAPELGAVSATGIFVNRRMKDVLENMKNQDMENNLENYIKELDADPFYEKYPELKDKMIEGYTEMMFGEKKAQGGRAGFSNGGIDVLKLEDEALQRAINAFKYYQSKGGKKNFRDYLKQAGEKGDQFRADGGRIGLKDGMDRRTFLKIMGGLASIPILGKFFKGAKIAAPAVEAARETITKAPSYFFDLAAKIKILGKESSTARRERMVEVNYKNYTLEEDLVTGDMTIIKRKGDPEFAYEEEIMSLRKGQADETTKGKTPPDEYDEFTARPDGDGKMKDVEDGIEPESIQEIVEEVGQGGGNLDQRTLEEIARGKLASGGVAMMLGE